MKKRELVPENYKKIYGDFRDFEPSERIQDIGFAVMHAALKSEVHYLGGAEDIIYTHTHEGGSVLLAPNHQSNYDTPTIAGLVYEEAFEELKGTTIIPAKAEMFGWPLVGRFIPHMLAHPTFRYEDFNGDDALRRQVTNALIDFNIEHIDAGGNGATFAQGKRNKNKPWEISPLKSGLARIALGVKNPEGLLITTAGFAYRINTKLLKLRPVVVVNVPFSPEGMSQEQVLEETRKRMQEATNEAFSLAA